VSGRRLDGILPAGDLIELAERKENFAKNMNFGERGTLQFNAFHSTNERDTTQGACGSCELHALGSGARLPEPVACARGTARDESAHTKTVSPQSGLTCRTLGKRTRRTRNDSCVSLSSSFIFLYRLAMQPVTKMKALPPTAVAETRAFRSTRFCSGRAAHVGRREEVAGG
jgi:hypothetical protein